MIFSTLKIFACTHPTYSPMLTWRLGNCALECMYVHYIHAEPETAEVDNDQTTNQSKSFGDEKPWRSCGSAGKAIRLTQLSRHGHAQHCNALVEKNMVNIKTSGWVETEDQTGEKGSLFTPIRPYACVFRIIGFKHRRLSRQYHLCP